MREETHEYTMAPSTSELLKHALRPIHHKLDIIINALGETMADVSGLNAALDEIDADEVAAVNEFKVLAEEIAQLTTERAPTQEEIDSLTAKATAAAEALKAGTPTQAPPVEQPPVETPPVETPPAEETPPAA